MTCCPKGFLLLLTYLFTRSTGVIGYQSDRMVLHGSSASRFGRNRGTLYDSDGSASDHKPQLQASHEKNYTLLKCSVSNPKPNAEIYLLCPALANRFRTGHCYQGCTPTEPCSVRSRSGQKSCVPNDQTVFCEQVKYANGTTTIQVKIDRTDSRLSGFWSCTHAGMESAKFKISQENNDDSEPKWSGVSTSNNAGPVVGNNVSQNKYSEVDQRPLAYMRKPVILFTVLSILVLSLLINMGFCIRCMIMRCYIDAQNEGSKKTSCLAACLCLPKEMRKVSSIRMDPILPRSVVPQTMLNGSFQGSAGLIYPSASSTLQKTPLLIQPLSQTDSTGMAYYPAVSLTGTLGRPGGQRLYGSPVVQQQQQQQLHQGQPHSDGYRTPQLAYAMNLENAGLLSQSTGQQPSQHSFTAMNEFGKPANYTPSYIRAPSANAPSPSMSHKLLYSSNSPVIQPPQGFTPDQTLTLLTDGQNSPQYFLRFQPTSLGTHVVYDDVAAGNSSCVSSQNRSQNQSLLVDQVPTSMFQLPGLYQVPVTRGPSTETTPNFNSTRPGGSQQQTGSTQTGFNAGPISSPMMNGVSDTATPSLPPLGNPMNSNESDQTDPASKTVTVAPIVSMKANTTDSLTEPIVYSRLSGMAPLAKEVTPRLSVVDTNSKK